MIMIKSQDGEELINLEQIQCVRAQLLNPQTGYTEVRADCGGEDIYTLGRYGTLERAKEILNEILELYKSFASVTGSYYNLPKVYEMPAE